MMMGKLRHLGVVLFFAVQVGCGPAVPFSAKHPDNMPARSVAIKMRHQILFSSPTRQDVFEGFMVLFDDAFYVKAFAGPGVELFTIARDQTRRLDMLHIDSLKEQFDIKRVGDDIHRVYLMGCASAKPASVTTCTVDNEPIEETSDEQGNIVQRVFPSAHGIGLTVTYSSYQELKGKKLPKKVTLQWGTTKREMVIVMLSAEPADGDEASVLSSLLTSSR